MPNTIHKNEALVNTAHWTASVRAMESARADALFRDAWAADLAGAMGATWIAGRSPESVVPIIIRTRYFDDFLQRITEQEQIRQVILLGAGLDTRAYRLSWPEGTQLLEIDQPALSAYKENFFDAAGCEAGCTRRAIGMDLASPWSEALRSNGFATEERSVWLLEGLLFYLPNEQIAQVLNLVTTLAAPGSWLAFDIINSVMLSSPLTQKWLEMQAEAGAPWIGTMDDPVGYLAERGWTANLSQAGAPEAHYGRWPFPVFPTTLPGLPHNWYVTARKEKHIAAPESGAVDTRV